MLLIATLVVPPSFNLILVINWWAGAKERERERENPLSLFENEAQFQLEIKEIHFFRPVWFFTFVFVCKIVLKFISSNCRTVKETKQTGGFGELD